MQEFLPILRIAHGTPLDSKLGWSGEPQNSKLERLVYFFGPIKIG